MQNLIYIHTTYKVQYIVVQITSESPRHIELDFNFQQCMKFSYC